MQAAVLFSIGSIAWVILWTFIFLYEDRTGRRWFLAPLRRAVDAVATHIETRYVSITRWWGAGRVRLFIHFLVHSVLRYFLSTARGAEKRLQALLRHNKRKAKKLQMSQSEAPSYLQQVAEHKESIVTNRKQRVDS